MKILSAKQIRELDAYTIKTEPVSSIDLMERASHAFVEWFAGKFPKEKEVMVFCGPGNNGGDGLAISRILLEVNYRVKTFILSSEKYSEDFKKNQSRLSKISTIFYIRSKKDIPDIPDDSVVIDAIFGSGLTRPVQGLYADVIQSINASVSVIVSVDIASGLFSDAPNSADDVIVSPHYTLSFQLPKLAFLLPQNEKHTGEWHIADIGLSKDFIKGAKTDNYYVTEEDIRPLVRKRKKFSHKGNYGKCLLIGGSYGMTGAMVLAARASLRTGAGLSFTYVPKGAYEILQSSVPENIVLTDPENSFISEIPDLANYNAIGIGPGLGRQKETAAALKKLLRQSTTPLVIDADALNIISANRDLIEMIPEGSILTPHPKEFERLAGSSSDDFERLDLLKKFAGKINSTVILKGAHTAVAAPDGKIYFNSTGNPGMATGGSGDVLTGIITSLLGQGYDSYEAALTGVFMHGYAGDVAAKEKSEPSLLPSDIVEAIPGFYKYFHS
jgi:NAD(P)H-hydrate epimerase